MNGSLPLDASHHRLPPDMLPLPVQLIVVDELRDDPQALMVCSLVSSDWRRLAQRHIFKTRFVKFNEDVHTSRDFVRTMVTPQMASLIRHIEYRFSTFGLAQVHMDYMETNMDRVIEGLGLQDMPNLLTLNLVDMMPHTDVGVLIYVPETTHRLVSLTDLALANIDFPDVWSLQALLASFPALANLTLCSVDWIVANSHQAAPYEGLALQNLSITWYRTWQPNNEALEDFFHWLLTTPSVESLRHVSYLSRWDSFDGAFFEFVRTLSTSPGSDLSLSIEDEALLQYGGDDDSAQLQLGPRVKTLSILNGTAFRFQFEVIGKLSAPRLRRVEFQLNSILTDMEHSPSGDMSFSVRNLDALRIIEVYFTAGVKRVWGAEHIRDIFKGRRELVTITYSPPRIEFLDGKVDESRMTPEDMDFQRWLRWKMQYYGTVN